MRIALADVGRRARMDLTFALQHGRTVLREAFFEVPFKITRLLTDRAPAAHVILMHCTAGLFGGDHLECSIRVERGARVLITQQSATKIHPSRDCPAVQQTRIFVDDGAELHLYLDPVIPFAGSWLRQATELHVEPGGTLSFWEGFMTGRVGRGESWQFRELSSETRLSSGGSLLYLDRFRLIHDRPPRALRTHAYVGTGLYVGENADVLSAKLRHMLPEAGVDCPASRVAAVRMVSATGPQFHRGRDLFCTAATELE